MTPSVAENLRNRGKRCRNSYERSKDCPLIQRKCKRTSWSHFNISCKRWKKGTISCLGSKGRKRGHKRYKASRSRENMQKERKRAWRQEEKCGKSKKRLIGKNSLSVCCRTKSIKTRWQMRRWRQSFSDCKLEKKEEVAMHRRQVTAVLIKNPMATNCCCVRCSGSEPGRCFGQFCFPKVQRKWSYPCQEETKEEGIVKMNKSKAEPLSSWCHSRQAGSIKLHQGAVWSLTFLVYGVYLVKAEAQEDQATDPDRQDGLPGMRKDDDVGESVP